jgi:hypothetical protein
VKEKSSVRRMSSMKRLKVRAALRRPKYMKGNSNRPISMVMAEFYMSAG